MESIVKANDQGKIKIRKVTDHTAAEVEIIVELAQGISPDITIDALYAFTDCEVSISPNTCVIENDKPRFLKVSELLKTSADNFPGFQLLQAVQDSLDSWSPNQGRRIALHTAIVKSGEVASAQH